MRQPETKVKVLDPYKISHKRVKPIKAKITSRLQLRIERSQLGFKFGMQKRLFTSKICLQLQCLQVVLQQWLHFYSTVPAGDTFGDTAGDTVTVTS